MVKKLTCFKVFYHFAMTIFLTNYLNMDQLDQYIVDTWVLRLLWSKKYW